MTIRSAARSWLTTHASTVVATTFGVMIASALATTMLSLERDVHAQTPRCDTPPRDSVTLLTVPGNPFQALPTSDGCWVFASLVAPSPGSHSIAVISRRNGSLQLINTVTVPSNPSGMALTHDEKVLIVAAGQMVLFMDVNKMQTDRSQALLGVLKGDIRNAGRVYANVSPDDAFAFISDERAMSITVIDLAKSRKDSFKKIHVVGQIPTGGSPIALTFSNDGKFIYTTSQVAPAHLQWPETCKPAGANARSDARNRAQGAILVVDAKLATTKPAKSVVSYVRAGCSPVRLVLSPSGDVAYVTARADNQVLAFATDKLVSDTAHARIGSTAVGTAPVGMAVVNNGKTLIVTNSNRFAGGADDKQSLSVLDVAKIVSGGDANVASIPAGAFPRELRVTSDGKLLIATNFNSQTIQVVDLSRMSFVK